jgi:phenylacetate-coenzyme A ligase PaaK-like adenylate-forming protein
LNDTKYFEKHQVNPLTIFNQEISFEEKALEIFRFQALENNIYRNFITALKVNPEDVKSIEEIPFLPVSFFKTHKVISGNASAEIIFTSSGTAGETSSHYVKDTGLYIESFSRSFRQFYGDIKEYCFLALLPSYLEREGSSLVYMCDHLIKESGHSLSGFYLHNRKELQEHLQQLKKQQQKTLLLGVTYALLDQAAEFPVDFPELIIMETGGMKGRRKEMIREEVHDILKKGFNVPAIHSEYGMTELLSQAWSLENGVYFCPPWMKVLIRNVNDPMEVSTVGSGGVNIIDLANIYSCSFIATQDLGILYPDHSFTINGRFDNSDLRGCNLMIL